MFQMTIESHVFRDIFIVIYIACSKTLTEETKYYCKVERTNSGHLISIYIVASSAFCHFLHLEQILSDHIFGFQCMEIGGKKFP